MGVRAFVAISLLFGSGVGYAQKPEPQPLTCSQIFLKETDPWNVTMGKLWGQILAHSLTIRELHSPKLVVVEVAPGKMPKVGIGLAIEGFKGTLHVIEPDPSSAEIVSAIYRDMMPEATIVTHVTTLEEAVSKIGKVDVLLANHPLDDMVAARVMGTDHLHDYFTNHYGNGDSATFWKELENHRQEVPKLVYDQTGEWVRAIQAMNPKLIGISQYESYYFRSHGLKLPDEIGFSALWTLQGIYGKTDPDFRDLIARYEQDPDRWMVIQRPDLKTP